VSKAKSTKGTDVKKNINCWKFYKKKIQKTHKE